LMIMIAFERRVFIERRGFEVRILLSFTVRCTSDCRQTSNKRRDAPGVYYENAGLQPPAFTV